MAGSRVQTTKNGRCAGKNGRERRVKILTLERNNSVCRMYDRLYGIALPGSDIAYDFKEVYN